LNGFNRRAGFYTWFYRILVNLCLDQRRRSGRVAWEPLDEEAASVGAEKEFTAATSSPDREAMAKEVSNQVGAALETLPPKQRTAFLLRNHQDLSIREIAKVMRTAEGTVKVHLHRAVIALRQRLTGVI
jgi:RNA polymerase sigma-70 factor (ECF subfamily)